MSRQDGTPITQRTASRYLIGQTIDAVDVECIPGAPGADVFHVRYLRLADGTKLGLSTRLVDGQHVVVMTRYSPKRAKPIPEEG